MKAVYTDGFFAVGADHGFLPCVEPLARLSEQYKPIQDVVDSLPTFFTSTEAGLIEAAIAAMDNVNEACIAETDVPMLAALFRALTFLCSGYLLAPSHFNKDADGKYGVAHQILPAQIAQPLCTVASKLDVHPFLDYHYSYSLGNYVKRDPAGDLHWNNLDMACSFTGTSDEVGFIMNHVYINERSPDLLRGIHGAFSSAGGSSTAEGLQLVCDTLKEMNNRRRTMWTASNPKNYNNFRAFIMGIKGNEEIFGDGVVYEGVSTEKRNYRGQTGAQDDIIPTLDIFSGVIGFYPNNMLTQYLLDLRQYRPKCVQAFFGDLEREAPTLLSSIATDIPCLIVLLSIVEQIYFFRNGHWQFVQKYIMANTKYAKATGGTPIISWIPNQIEAVLKYMTTLIERIGAAGDSNADFMQIRDTLAEKITLLNHQLEELKNVDYNVERIWELNTAIGKVANLDDTKVELFTSAKVDSHVAVGATSGGCPMGH